MFCTRVFRVAGAACVAGVATAILLAITPTRMQAQTTFDACYIEGSGVLYLLNQPGLPTECRNPGKHVQFSWRDGLAGNEHGALNGLGDDDHIQYLLADGSRALGGNLAAGGNMITGLGAASAAGEAVRYEQAVKSGDATGGDLGGTYPTSLTVEQIQGNAVSATAPTDGQTLVWNATESEWQPATIVTNGGGLSNPEIVGDTEVFTEPGIAWLHANCPTGKIAINGGHSIERNYGGYNEYRFVVADHPDNGGRSWSANAWVGFVSDDPVGGLALHISVYALCVDGG